MLKIFVRTCDYSKWNIQRLKFLIYKGFADCKIRSQNRLEKIKQFCKAEEHKIGAIGLWHTILKLIGEVDKAGYEFIILCEDDHQFTEDYSPSVLFSSIAEAVKMDADVLLGGPSWFS